MKYFVLFTILAGFISLSVYSLQPRPSVETLFVEQKLAEYETEAKPVILTREVDDAPIRHRDRGVLFKQHQAQALVDVWGLTAEDATKPIDLFAEAKQ